MARHKNMVWSVGENVSVAEATLTVLMDIRDELQSVRNHLGNISATMSCRNFQRIPAKIDRIGRNTEARKGAKTQRKAGS
jgi:hypothetical protein